MAPLNTAEGAETVDGEDLPLSPWELASRGLTLLTCAAAFLLVLALGGFAYVRLFH